MRLSGRKCSISLHLPESKSQSKVQFGLSTWIGTLIVDFGHRLVNYCLHKGKIMDLDFLLYPQKMNPPRSELSSV